MGELVKFNRVTLEIFESCFDDNQFSDFMNIVMENLIDSNVFIRSLFLTLESISGKMAVLGKSAYADKFDLGPQCDSSRTYLTHSWTQTLPTVVSIRAIERISSQPSRKASLASAVYKRVGTRDGIDIDGGGGAGGCSTAAGSTTLSSLSKGVMDVFRGIHSAASNLVSSSPTQSQSQSQSQPQSQPQSMETSPARLESSSPPSSTPRTPKHSPYSPKCSISPSTESPANADPKKSASPSAGWSMPDTLFRISLFLTSERETILVRLMSIVSLHSVNHGITLFFE